MVAEAAMPDHELVAIGGGARGVNLHLAPKALVEHLGAAVVEGTVPA